MQPSQRKDPKEIEREAQQQQKAALARHKKKIIAFDSVIKLLQSQPLKEEKVIIGSHRFSLFKGSSYSTIVERQNKKIVELLASFFTPSSENPEKTEGDKRAEITNYLIREKVILRAKENERASRVRNANDKYLIIAEENPQPLTDSEIKSGIFVFNPTINIQPKSNYVYMVLILLGIALIILFPVWPMIIKRGLFYLSVVMLFAIVGLVIVRTLVFLLVRGFGIEFYIFPNLFADVGVLESFQPLFGYEKCKDSPLMMLFRFVGMIILGYFLYILSLERYAVKDFGQQTFDDILDWGYEKLESKPAPPLRSIDQMLSDFDREMLKLEAEEAAESQGDARENL